MPTFALPVPPPRKIRSPLGSALLNLRKSSLSYKRTDPERSEPRVQFPSGQTQAFLVNQSKIRACFWCGLRDSDPGERLSPLHDWEAAILTRLDQGRTTVPQNGNTINEAIRDETLD